MNREYKIIRLYNSCVSDIWIDCALQAVNDIKHIASGVENTKVYTEALDTLILVIFPRLGIKGK